MYGGLFAWVIFECVHTDRFLSMERWLIWK